MPFTSDDMFQKSDKLIPGTVRNAVHKSKKLSPLFFIFSTEILDHRLPDSFLLFLLLSRPIETVFAPPPRQAIKHLSVLANDQLVGRTIHRVTMGEVGMLRFQQFQVQCAVRVICDK